MVSSLPLATLVGDIVAVGPTQLAEVGDEVNVGEASTAAIAMTTTSLIPVSGS